MFRGSDNENGTTSHSHADPPNQLETTEAAVKLAEEISPSRNFEKIEDNSTTDVQRGEDDGNGNTSHSHSDAPDQLETAPETTKVSYWMSFGCYSEDDVDLVLLVQWTLLLKVCRHETELGEHEGLHEISEQSFGITSGCNGDMITLFSDLRDPIRENDHKRYSRTQLVSSAFTRKCHSFHISFTAGAQ